MERINYGDTMKKILFSLILVFVLIPFDSYAEEQKENQRKSAALQRTSQGTGVVAGYGSMVD